MRYVAAYLLVSLTGNEPTAAEIEKILSSVGIESDAERVKTVISELKGKNITEVIGSGKLKMATIPSGGGAVAAGGTAVAAAPEAAAAAAAPAKGKEKEPEPSEDEEDDDMGFGLFD